MTGGYNELTADNVKAIKLPDKYVYFKIVLQHYTEPGSYVPLYPPIGTLLTSDQINKDFGLSPG